ncbi:MAG TPA: hypothetical protein PLE49_06140 [Mycobacterium sp.]|nr:hypothetical protein [Mycobacterium sp.]
MPSAHRREDEKSDGQASFDADAERSEEEKSDHQARSTPMPGVHRRAVDRRVGAWQRKLIPAVLR